jgi:hypothetical protein
VERNESDFTDIGFDFGFDAKPAVFSQVQDGPEAYLVTRHDTIGSDGFTVGIQQEEASLGASLADQQVGWVAIDRGTGSFDGRDAQVGSTGNSVSNTFTAIDFDSSIDGTPTFLRFAAPEQPFLQTLTWRLLDCDSHFCDCDYRLLKLTYQHASVRRDVRAQVLSY